jgi:rSAM/selenodomain-associated transferase 1
MAELFGGDLRYREQAGEELGQRMHGAFVDAFEERGSRVVMIGSDCPGLTADRLGEALDALRRQDMVLGPASDGGYYLIGLSRPEPGLFEGIAWGGERVLTQTLSQADGLGLSVHRLGVLSDVDRPEDLHVWRRMETGEQRNAEGDS